MSDHVRAFWVAAPGFGEIRSEPMPPPREGDVVVRTLYSGISRGTESLVFNGHVPVSEYRRMRVPFQAGDFPAPVKYGYATVGIVEEGPPELAGKPVFVLHPHQTRYAVPASWVHPIPPDVPPPRAVLTANLETAITGLWDAQPRVGDRIAVIGAGTVGCLVAWLAGRIPGCAVQLIDVNPGRASIAQSLGVDFADPADAADEADVVFHVSGNGAGLHTALRVAGFEAKIVEMSWYGDASVTLPLGEAFHTRRLLLASSQVGHIPGSQHARWTTQRRMALALALLADPVLDVLITGESDFDSMPAVMTGLAASQGRALCHRIRYPQSR